MARRRGTRRRQLPEGIQERPAAAAVVAAEVMRRFLAAPLEGLVNSFSTESVKIRQDFPSLSRSRFLHQPPLRVANSSDQRRDQFHKERSEIDSSLSEPEFVVSTSEQQSEFSDCIIIGGPLKLRRNVASAIDNN